MKNGFLLLFLLIVADIARAQVPDDAEASCQAGKARYFGRLASNPRARVAYPGDATIDVTYYGLDLRLTHTPNYLRGAATLTVRSTGNNAGQFYLDLRAQMIVDSVKSAGRPLPFTRTTDRITITPPQPLSAGQALTLTVYYQGNPVSSGFGSFAFSAHGPNNTPVIWSLSEPYGASDWFPCKDTPADKADSSTVSITADKQFVSVSNGVLTATTDNPDGTRTYRWRNSYPIAQYLISLAMTNYERYDTPFTSGGQTMPVTHYIYPERLASVRANLDRTPDMLRLFTDRFGPYPFLREKYGHAQFGWGGGMEHQTISSMGAFNTGIIAHELAHQWFGDKITCRDWQNIWLNEGFASYAEALYAESASPVTGYQSTMSTFLTNARAARGTLYVQDISDVNTIFNSNRTYAKGATVLHMLRRVLGDDVFFRTLKAYVAAPTVAYGTAVTEDFQAVAEQVSGQQLGYFFKQWIYGEGYPTYRASYAGNSAGGSVTVRLEQPTTTATNPVSFTMPVQIRVQSAAGDTTITVFNDRADQTFTLPTKGSVTGVVIDPDNWILKAVEPANLVTAVPEPTLNLRVYPNPTTETVRVDFTTASAGPLALLLTSGTGQRVWMANEPRLAPGNHTRTLRLPQLPAGHYTLTIKTGSGQQSRVVLIR